MLWLSSSIVDIAQHEKGINTHTHINTNAAQQANVCNVDVYARFTPHTPPQKKKKQTLPQYYQVQKALGFQPTNE